MDLHIFLRSRRSIRRFKPSPVSDSTIRKILTTATYAPSAHNRQPWRFIVLTGDGSKSNFADSMAVDFRRDLERDNLPEDEIFNRLEKSRSRIATAPVIIIVCMDSSEMDSYPDAQRAQAERIMAIQSTSNAGLQLLLAAHAEGLGAVWMCAPLFTQNTVRSTFNLPITWEPVEMFLMGYPAETPEVRERKSIEKITRFI
jgi:coenzyme F420-0:L-glutamate ligase / coenzyme F420-1:gamma-L-glutamate ligase